MVTDGLRKIGYNKPVDDFIVSMNRAAEKAAPQAKSIFIDAIKEMTFDDAKKILNGNKTAATEYFKTKASEKLYDAFNPIISSSVNEVGATRYYKDMLSKFSSLPFVKAGTLNLDDYVTNKALEGLFYMIGEEEKKIRTDPKARVTELLEKVFKKAVN
jgi:vacuolar-type H+-ATPase subunit H